MGNKRSLFGTDGIRGKANIYPMTCEVAMALGRAVTYYFQKSQKNPKPLIVIGKDTRLSCYMLEQAFVSGVCSQGGRAILTGPLPTPGVAFVTQSMRANAGVMISASHNHFSDNGIKIFDPTGHKLPDEVEEELEKMIHDPSLLPRKTDGDLGNVKRLDEVVGRYVVHTKSTFEKDYTLDNMRLVVDCANGAAYRVAPMIFEELGAEVFPMGTSPNGQNINLACGSLYPEACASEVERLRADMGICLDGDADRVAIVDENGVIVSGDAILGLCAKFLMDRGEFPQEAVVIGTVMSNLGLEHFLNKIGIQFKRVQVGDRYIVEEMRKSDAIFGGEPSGHIIFKNYSTTGDGIVAALKILECIKYYEKPLSELVQEINLYPQILKNVEVVEKRNMEKIPAIVKKLKEVEQRLAGEGRVLLRYSGTESKARVMIEGRDEALITELTDELAHTIYLELGPGRIEGDK